MTKKTKCDSLYLAGNIAKAKKEAERVLKGVPSTATRPVFASNDFLVGRMPELHTRQGYPYIILIQIKLSHSSNVKAYGGSIPPLLQETMIKDKKEANIIYSLGRRDMLASVLAETKDTIKLPEFAIYYEQLFNEKHYSHEWHTS